MSMTIQVGTTPIQILSPGRHKPTVVANIGQNEVWINDTSSVNADSGSESGFPLFEGQAIQWDEDMNLWVVCSSAYGRGVLSLLDMRGTVFSLWNG